MKSYNLPNGRIFTFDIPTKADIIEHTILDTVWIEIVGGDTKLFLSLCGHYRIESDDRFTSPDGRVYDCKKVNPYFTIKEALIWRENLQSIFGVYVKGINRTKFETFELAAAAVANHVNTLHNV